MPNLLIAIDIQKGFVTESSSHIVQPITTIQHVFNHVVFSKFYNPNPSPFRKILDYDKLAPGSTDTELALTIRKDAFIVERPLYSCVTPLLLDYLNSLNIEEVYICGIATEACVLKTILDLFESNIRTLVIKNLCASDQDNHYHKIAIKLIGKLIGTQHIIKWDHS